MKLPSSVLTLLEYFGAKRDIDLIANVRMRLTVEAGQQEIGKFKTMWLCSTCLKPGRLVWKYKLTNNFIIVAIDGCHKIEKLGKMSIERCQCSVQTLS